MKMQYQDEYNILEKQFLKDNIVSLVIHCPDIAKMAVPGQFVNVKTKTKSLRRPISICEIDKVNGTIRIVFELKGDGTKEIASFDKTVDILGPLGNGIRLRNNNLKACLIGGGIGAPPMLELAKSFQDNCTAILGFQNKDKVSLEDDFNNATNNVTVFTDDGSYKNKGFVTNGLLDLIKTDKPEIIYACGPVGMLKAIASVAKDNSIPCFISLEERMGCGVGACLVCACKVKTTDGSDEYRHVCKDGPVFNALDIEF